MKQPKINSRDLKDPGYFFTYHPGRWEYSGGVEYRKPWIQVRRTWGDGRYSDEVFSLIGQSHRDTKEPARPAYAWHFEGKLEDAGDPAFARFLAAWKAHKPRTHRGAGIFPILAALKKAGIHRWIGFERERFRTDHVPRKYKGREAQFTQARELVAA